MASCEVTCPIDTSNLVSSLLPSLAWGSFDHTEGAGSGGESSLKLWVISVLERAATEQVQEHASSELGNNIKSMQVLCSFECR